MITFLEKLTDDLLHKHNGDLSTLCLVFPTRRAGLFFKKNYSAKLTSPAWSPAIYAIEDFIQSLSNLRVADQLDLVFELYEIYHNYFPSESFDHFYPWGIMLLHDFEDADNSLPNTEQLFSTISDLKSIDEAFDLAEEDRLRMQEFWKLFFGKEQGAIRKNFLDTWKHLSNIYSEFKKQLLKKNLAYHGLVARTVNEMLQKEDLKISINSSHYVFAGFNALSKAEERIIQFFIEKKKGTIYYDTDEYYVDDLKQEAGTFIRRSTTEKAHWDWKESLLSNDEKRIETIGVPLQSLQAKMAGQIMKQEQNFSLEKTAIVLPDEKLLIPLLCSLPTNIADLNVTMGYPLHASPLFTLIESLFELQKSFRNNPPSFHFKNVLNVVSHPYLQNLYSTEINRWMTEYRENLWLRISQEDLFKANSNLFKSLFASLDGQPLQEWYNYFDSLFSLLIEGIQKNKSRIHSIEKEFVYYFYTRYKKLKGIIEKFNQDISVETFRNLFKEVIYSTRIPFTGEPLKGLQVMGFLETRVLDFETVIILSVNEGVLPASSYHPSFIPYTIRKAFGLPTYEEQNAIAAYHFYRLLQRAKNIYLIYNTEVKSLSGGEKSRFILQIENELLRRNKNIKYVNRTANLVLKEPDIQPIIIKKTEEVMKKLDEYARRGAENAEKKIINSASSTPLREPNLQNLKYAKKFSASALIQYIACPLRFYLKYIAGLKEKEEAEETMEGGLFGTILHEAMSKLYKSSHTLTATDFQKIKQKIEAAANEAISKHYTRADRLEGKNILMKNVLIELLHRIVAFDSSQAPLAIKSLEKEFGVSLTLETIARRSAENAENGKINSASSVPLRESLKPQTSNPNPQSFSVTLYGVIDRIDQSNGCLRIVDYKTGKPDFKKANSTEQLFISPEYKEQFQTFFYSWLLHKTGVGVEAPIKAGLFRLKEFSQGISYINNGKPITDEQFTEFEKELKKLLEDIFNPDISFAQTEDKERCVYCSFKDICNR